MSTTIPPLPPTGKPAGPLVVSQLGPDVNRAIAAHWSAPRVRTLADGEAPWALREPADIQIVRPWLGWLQAPRERPPGWPGARRWVMTASAGVDFFPPWFLEAPVVTCGRGIAAVPIAEYVFAAMLAETKALAAIAFRGPEGFRQADLPGLAGRTLGLAGFGAIGSAIASRAQAFGMTVMALRRSGWDSPPPGIVPATDIGDLAAAADHLVLALPATPQTRHIINAAVLERARPGQHLINIARGSLIDQDALIAALDRGRLAAATLDVTDPEPLPAGHPLYTHPKVRLTPHISWCSADNGARLTALVLDNLDRFMRGEPLVATVDPVSGY